MKNGGIILTAIAILFLAMYVYSYSFDYFARLRENMKLKKQAKKEALLNEQKAINAKVREEKFRKLSKRSREIQEELERLAEFRNNLLKKQEEKKKIIKVNHV